MKVYYASPNPQQRAYQLPVQIGSWLVKAYTRYM